MEGLTPDVPTGQKVHTTGEVTYEKKVRYNLAESECVIRLSTCFQKTEEYTTNKHILPILRKTHSLAKLSACFSSQSTKILVHTTIMTAHATIMLPKKKVGPNFLVITVIGG